MQFVRYNPPLPKCVYTWPRGVVGGRVRLTGGIGVIEANMLGAEQGLSLE